MNLEPSDTFRPEDLLATLMNHAPLGIISLDASGVITQINRLAVDLLRLGPPHKKMPGQNLVELVDHLPVLHDKLSRFLATNKKSLNTGIITIDDRHLILKAVRSHHGFICIINEVTRLKEMEAESIQSMITGQENERRRIAREIHDGIGPLLSYSKLELDAFLDEFVDHHNHLAEEKLLNIRQTLDSITNDLRDLSHHLIPRLLEEFGLFSAFSSLTTRLGTSVKSSVTFYCNFGTELRFGPNLELNLYRCGQELINNAVKHAGASEILVQLIKHEHSLVLMVEDDGIGFDPQNKKEEYRGIGLTNIETRVRTLNGEFLIESQDRRGTSASIEIPC